MTWDSGTWHSGKIQKICYRTRLDFLVSESSIITMFWQWWEWISWYSWTYYLTTSQLCSSTVEFKICSVWKRLVITSKVLPERLFEQLAVRSRLLLKEMKYSHKQHFERELDSRSRKEDFDFCWIFSILLVRTSQATNTALSVKPLPAIRVWILVPDNSLRRRTSR